MFPEMEVVIHVDFGGFHIDDEMALWLMENRGWTVTKDHNANADLCECFGNYFYPLKYEPDSVVFRSHPDIVSCVRALQAAHKDDEYRERYYGYIHKLKIQKVRPYLSIENYYDGKERLSVGWNEVD